MIDEQHLCDYGCGQVAIKQFGNGKWCCSESHQQCPNSKMKTNPPKGTDHWLFGKHHSKETREKLSKINIGQVSPMKGKKHSKESLKIMSETHKGQIPWNKGLTGVYSEESKSRMGKSSFGKDNQFYGKKHSDKSKKIMSEKKKGYVPWIKGKSHSKETRKKISEAHTGLFRTKESIIKTQSTIKALNIKYPLFSKIEKMRYDPKYPGERIIQIHCKNCSKWFIPTYNKFYQRIRAIEDSNGNQAGYFYCCDDCKNECPLYNKKTTQIIKEDEIRAGNIKEKLYTSSEYNTWRDEVLKRADYLCEYCEDPANNAHHSRPQKLEPGFVLDPDFGIACCEKCHYKYGHKTETECSTGNLASTICR